MAGSFVRGLNEVLRTFNITAEACRALPRRAAGPTVCRRTMASEARPSDMTRSTTETGITRSTTEPWSPVTHVPLTIYSFPSLEPVAVESWSTKHIHMPLRRDLLHLAVIYEGDKTRQGTASSKTRWDVAGSHVKLRPQKGTGKARVGSRQSPTRVGGGKAHGPHPRDFSTSLNRKVYDRAWRMALSWRYRRGELVVTEDGMELPLPAAFFDMVQGAKRDEYNRQLEDGFVRKFTSTLMSALKWGRGNGRTTFVTMTARKNLSSAMKMTEKDGRALTLDDVDVKDLLETGRIVIERSALREMVKKHQSDLVSNIVIRGKKVRGPTLGQTLLTAA